MPRIRIKRTNPEIAYAGSLCQQNHGELPMNHGYLVWNVSSSHVEEFVEIPNKVGYYTITLLDNKNMPATPNMPEVVRLRMYVDDIDDTFVKKVISVLRKTHNIIECNINRTKTSLLTTSTPVSISAINNINDVSQQNKHIRLFIDAHLPETPTSLIDRVCEINTTLNTKIGDDELPYNITWRPRLLEFDNLFSYGSGNKINFDSMSGLYGMFSPNATGKTSAFDALCFALYDKTPRAFKGTHIMNTRKNEFLCKLTIDIDGIDYTIERTGSRKKTGEVKVGVNFYKMDGDNKISLNGADRRSTNLMIRSYVGTYEDFILTNLSVQNQNTLFIETGQTDRKDLLSQFIGLTIFDRLLTLATDERRELLGALKSFKKTDFTQELATTQLENQQLQSKHDSIVENINSTQSSIVDIQTHINKLQSSIITVPAEYNDIQPRIIQRDKLVLVASDLKEKIELLRAEKTIVDEQFTSLRQKQTELGNYDVLLSARTELERIKQKISVLNTQLHNLTVDERHLSDKIKNLSNHKYDPNCKYCTSNIFVLDAKNAINQLSVVKLDIEKIQRDISIETDAENNVAPHAAEYNIWSRLAAEITTQDRLQLSVDGRLLKAVSELETTCIKLTSLEDFLLKAEEFKQLDKNNSQLNLEIVSENNKKKVIETTLSALNDARLDLYGKLTVLQSKKEDMLRSIRDAEEQETTQSAYETYINVIGRDGLPYELISSIIPHIQVEINTILEQIVDFTISLEVDGKNINGNIIYDDTRVWPMELASGMERFISSLAIRIALMSISNLPKSNFLIIDEGMGVLDADNLASMTTLFNILSQKFDFIILISHLETTKDISENLIEIKRKDGYSTIVVE